MDVVELKLETVNKILSFLSEHPWKSVNTLMAEIHKEVSDNPPYVKEVPGKPEEEVEK